MGYALIMFGVLLLTSVVIAVAVDYGIAKDSKTAPLWAENTYADIKTGQAQTGLTIVNTCLSGNGAYVIPSSSAKNDPYTLWLTVRNNGSIVLNPNNSTVFYNSSYYGFNVTSGVGSSVPFGNAWSPLINSTVQVSNIYIISQDSNYPLRLMTATSNGIEAIAPTAPTNFSGTAIKDNTTYSFSWTPSTDVTGIDYYILYTLPNQPAGTCDQNNNPTGVTNITIISGNATTENYPLTCGKNCPSQSFMIIAVDNEGNMGVQSVTINCNPPNTGADCKRFI